MSRLACLVGARPQHRYFVSTLHAAQPLGLIVVQARRGSGLRGTWRRIRCAVATHSLALARGTPPLQVTSRGLARACDAVFGPAAWRAWPRDVPLMVVENVNDPAVVERLASLGPDVLLDHGTGIVRAPVLETAPLALNLHWGLSPWYRGTRCTEWALLAGDLDNIGVSIHALTARIDGGPIVSQARVPPRPGDDVDTINMRLSHAGTSLVLRVLGRLRDGKKLEFRAQDLSQGQLTLDRHWTRDHGRRLRSLLRGGRIPKSMLD